MNITRTTKNDVAIVRLEGKLTFGNDIQDFRQAMETLKRENVKNILFNTENLSVIDSSGLGELIRAYTTFSKAGGKVKILKLSEKLKDLLVVTKIITIFETYDNEEDALKSF